MEILDPAGQRPRPDFGDAHFDPHEISRDRTNKRTRSSQQIADRRREAFPVDAEIRHRERHAHHARAGELGRRAGMPKEAVQQFLAETKEPGRFADLVAGHGGRRLEDVFLEMVGEGHTVVTSGTRTDDSVVTS